MLKGITRRKLIVGRLNRVNLNPVSRYMLAQDIRHYRRVGGYYIGVTRSPFPQWRLVMIG